MNTPKHIRERIELCYKESFAGDLKTEAAIYGYSLAISELKELKEENERLKKIFQEIKNSYIGDGMENMGNRDEFIYSISSQALKQNKQ